MKSSKHQHPCYPERLGSTLYRYHPQMQGGLSGRTKQWGRISEAAAWRYRQVSPHPCTMAWSEAGGGKSKGVWETRPSTWKPLRRVTNYGEDQLASNYFAILEGIWATTQVSAQPLHRAMTYEIRKKLKRSIVTKRILRKVSNLKCAAKPLAPSPFSC